MSATSPFPATLPSVEAISTDSRLYLKHIKGLFRPETLRRLHDHFTACEGRYRNLRDLSERERKAIDRGESADAMRMQDTWYDAWREADHTRLLQELRPFTFVTYPVQVRHVRENSHAVPWHQDYGYMKLLGTRRHACVITCFVPLEPNPAACTTLQFAHDNRNGPEEEIDHVPMDGFGAGLSPDRFRQTEYYRLSLGDALAFGDLVLHRTFTPPGWEIERRSLEFRLVKPADALPGKDYLDLEKMQFVKTDETGKVKDND